ncbi:MULTISPECIES: prolyl aminopeptidase [unclassified Paludibacterium]|uniref:prolyl aminopeptidase n=1 Tax=unclassified Paludibacterium TaxID=2618429 RepID=UPI001C049A12|nr:prolyl aminopeptidase [Paludibacterium sp. B53371]BEV72854.1 prolyl aminopeptidase [Paludibacterium sp. THUN1379]
MLYPAIAPYESGMLRLDELHQMYWEQCGRPDGFPVLYLHGGPGDGCAPMCRQLFDPGFYRAVLFDQRGSGRSVPRGELRANRTDLLVADIERLREHLGIERWLVFGGSWGSTLALAYAEAHPERVGGLILRGIFLGRERDVDWFMHGMGRFFPEAWAQFLAPIPPEERGDLLQAYYRRLSSDDPSVYLPVCQAWGGWEAHCVSLLPRADAIERAASPYLSLPLARLEAHYFAHQLFLQPDQLLREIGRIAHLPACIVQGRYDVICPPEGAYALAAAWPKAELCLVEAAGHSMWEPAVLAALMDRLERFKLFLGRGSV